MQYLVLTPHFSDHEKLYNALKYLGTTLDNTVLAQVIRHGNLNEHHYIRGYLMRNEPCHYICYETYDDFVSSSIPVVSVKEYFKLIKYCPERVML
jgi:hypothetical protein